jgi:hypothetical protein
VILLAREVLAVEPLESGLLEDFGGTCIMAEDLIPEYLSELAAKPAAHGHAEAVFASVEHS